MNKRKFCITKYLFGFLLFFCFLFPLSAFSRNDWQGTWKGYLVEKSTEKKIEFSVNVAEQGVLLDIPSSLIYGYPSKASTLWNDSFGAEWNIADIFIRINIKQKKQLFKNDSFYGDFIYNSDNESFSGTIEIEKVIPTGSDIIVNKDLNINMSDGAKISGSLCAPKKEKSKQLVIFHSALGETDKNGNNYNIPGRCDSIKLLSEELAKKGIASFRYDKRGAGLSSWLFSDESERSINIWISDLCEIVNYFYLSKNYSAIYLCGMNDGSVVASACAVQFQNTNKINGLIITCASSDSTLETYKYAVGNSPLEQQKTGLDIISSLCDGKIVNNLPLFYKDAFRKSIQPYLIEAFSLDIKKLLSQYLGKCLIIQGNSDIDVSLNQFLKLGKAKPDAKGVVVPRMNHVCKEVSSLVSDNRAAFSDPSYKIPEALVNVIVEFLTE